MPKVLRIINRFNLGGPTYNAAYLTKYLSPEFDTLLCGGTIDKAEGDATFIVYNLGIEPKIISEMHRSINLQADYKAYLKIKSIISDFKPDIVHTHASKAGALGRLAAYRMGVPVILHTFHGHVFDKYFSSLSSNIYIQIERFLAKRSSKIIALSENQKNELAHKFKICSEDKIHVIPLGFDLDRFQENTQEKRKSFREDYKINDDEIAIAIIGRLVPIKNHELFLNVVKEVIKKSTKKLRFFIVGDGESKEFIIQKAKDLDLTFTQDKQQSNKNLITFTSWIKEIDVVVAGVDIVMLTSLNEGTPVSIIEAQAGGKPVVSTNVGGIENVVIPGETAFLSPSNESNPLVTNLLLLIDSEELRIKMAAKGWLHVKEKFHYNRLVNDTKKLYTDLLKQ
ncbi:MAG TPA: glycosyltransferase [Bacteroidales bacterium]|nr:glycosyltransferase [Bacteroidales bacterium]HQH18048.1 glycosyltransferase [Bacteroidales bacterium]